MDAIEVVEMKHFPIIILKIVDSLFEKKINKFY
jgi:hypothetical protein